MKDWATMQNNAPRQINTRYVALKICLTVIEHGRSLSQSLAEGLAQFSDRRERAFAQNLVLGTLRWQERLEAIRALLLKKPLKAKDEDVNQLILLGLYQILYMETPEHAAVSETVNLTKSLKKPWAKALVNGVLRNFLREKDALCEEVDKKPAYKYAHPQWFTKQMRVAYPEHWQQILTANNEPAPLTLRVNTREQSREDFLALLNHAETESNVEADAEVIMQTTETAEAINEKATAKASAHPKAPQGVQLTHSLDISQLPTYETGGFSVQDAAAQQAANILAPKAGEHILDACAAPGGKTSHLLELSDNQASVFALEKEVERMERLSENLYRLDLEAELEVGDASQPDTWWSGTLFDKILLDAPCSATGIIRRHPDIKWHRTPEDIEALVDIQANILNALWPLLKVGGQLLYATCSVLPQENREQMATFFSTTPSAKQLPIPMNENQQWGAEFSSKDGNCYGRQILPGMDQMDGFYYCLIEKVAEA